MRSLLGASGLAVLFYLSGSVLAQSPGNDVRISRVPTVSTASDSKKEEPKKDQDEKPWEKFKKPAPSVLQKKLTRLQFRVTQSNDTEPAFRNEYHNKHDDGIYVDIVSGEPLFSSVDKFDSGTGWPSFVKPLEQDYIVTRRDTTENMLRIEVRSKYGDSHLGHVFNDGPADRGGLRFCMNSASLRFIPKDKMKEEGYGAYLKVFESK